MPRVLASSEKPRKTPRRTTRPPGCRLIDRRREQSCIFQRGPLWWFCYYTYRFHPMRRKMLRRSCYEAIKRRGSCGLGEHHDADRLGEPSGGAACLARASDAGRGIPAVSKPGLSLREIAVGTLGRGRTGLRWRGAGGGFRRGFRRSTRETCRSTISSTISCCGPRWTT